MKAKTTGRFDTWEELYTAVTTSMRRTQKETASDCGVSPSMVSGILIQERMRSRAWHFKSKGDRWHGTFNCSGDITGNHNRGTCGQRLVWSLVLSRNTVVIGVLGTLPPVPPRTPYRGVTRFFGKPLIKQQYTDRGNHFTPCSPCLGRGWGYPYIKHLKKVKTGGT